MGTGFGFLDERKWALEEALELEMLFPPPAAAGEAPRRRSRPKGTWAPKLIPLLNRHRGEIPLWFLIGWIAFESGGDIKSRTRLNELGYFQIHPDQSRDLRLYERFGKTHEELSTDPDFSIKAGILLVRSLMKRVKQLGYQPGAELFWPLVRWHHWLPRGIRVILAHMKRNGFRASNWDAFRKYVLDHRQEFLKLIPAKPGTGWDPAAGIRSVDRAFTLGHSLLSSAVRRETEFETGPTERVLDFITKWGRNASPFKIASLYLRLNWKGLSYWRDVAKSARAGRDLLRRIDGLERGARALNKATDELRSAESKLPGYPLQTDDKAGRIMLTDAELDYVGRYFNTAAIIANDAMAARSELDKAVAGWDMVVEQASNTNDFARQSAWDAITDLDLRFSNEGGCFRAYLVSARDSAARVESWSRMKQYHAAHILGKWTPEWYVPPAPPW